MKKIISRILVYANIIVVLLLLASGFAGYINPANHPYLSLLGFTFPAFLFANIACLVWWILFDFKRVIIPFVGLVLAYAPSRTYCPINKSSEPSKESIKILSYNVLGFNSREAPEGEPNPILDYILHSDADIVCIQEFARPWCMDSLFKEVENKYPYNDTLRSKDCASSIAIYSHFPIKFKEHLAIKTKSNLAGVFTLNVNGEMVRVINVHLETVGFSEEQKEQFHEIVHGKTDEDSARQQSKLLISKLAESAAVRSKQADVVDNYVRKHHGENIILCGDFNDHPLSYVHQTIARHLTDCYRESGLGFGYTMHFNSMHVRIDNIMCSDHWEPTDCKVDKSVTLSDHYPIYCFLEPKNSKE